MHAARLAIPAALLLVSLTGCRRAPTHARVDAAIAPLIPSDTVVLAGLRLDRMKETAFFKTYVDGAKLPQLADIRAKTGLDPAKDIWELVVAATPARSLLFIRGKFGGEFGLEPKFDVPGLERRSYKGYYVLEQRGQGVLFINSGVAVAGAVIDIRSIVDNRDKPGETAPRDLLSMVETLPPDHLWLVSRQAGALFGGAPARAEIGNFARLASALGRTSLHADLGDGISLSAEGDYPDAVLARQAQDTIRAFVGIARLRTRDDQADLLKVYDGIQATARENTLTLNVRVPFELLDTALRALPTPAARGARDARTTTR